MVTKARSTTNVHQARFGFEYNNTPNPSRFPQSDSADVVSETMKDSSETGSARTDLEPVDKFLQNPTNRGDFHKALRESSKTPGDAGLADFRVDRSIVKYSPWSGSWLGPTTGSYTMHCIVENFMIRYSDLTSAFPSLPVEPLNPADLKSEGQRGYLSALPNRTQVELGTALAEIAVNPAQALTIPGSAMAGAAKRWASQPTRSRKKISSEARRRHKRLRGLSKEAASAAAGDYLAYIFGAAPNIQVMDDLAEQISRSRRYAEIVSRQGWRRVRRKRVIRDISDTASTWTPGSWLHQNTGNTLMLDGPLIKSIESYQRIWWSGSFRMPTTDTDHWLDQCSEFFKRIDYLAGLGLDIKMAWDLVPFSFVADWFSNTGSYIENREVIRDYNIVCEYGYVMCHTRTTRRSECQGVLLKYPGGGAAYGSPAASCKLTRITETKQRAACSSYGFETDFSALNPYQWSALTAIGLVTAAGVKPRVRT